MAKTQNGLELDAGERIEFSDLSTQYKAAYTKEEIGSTSNGEGASLVDIEDSAGIITATNVEGALAENRGLIDTLVNRDEIVVNSRRLNCNGSFFCWQGETSFTTPGGGNVLADNWKSLKLGAHTAEFTVERSTDVPTGTYNYSIKQTITTADTSIASDVLYGYMTFVEGADYIRAIQAGYITLSFDIKATITGTQCIAVQNYGSNRSYISEITINSTETWESKSITIPIDTSGTWQTLGEAGLVVIFPVAVGSTYQTTKDSWQSGDYMGTSSQVNHFSAVDNIFLLKNVQVEPGEDTSPFEELGYRELSWSRRYRIRVGEQVNTPFANGFIIDASTARFFIKPTTTLRIFNESMTVTKVETSSWDFKAIVNGNSITVTHSSTSSQDHGNILILNFSGSFTGNAFHPVCLIHSNSGAGYVIIDCTMTRS